MLTPGATACALSSLLDKLTLEWFQLDLDIQSSLIANTPTGAAAVFDADGFTQLGTVLAQRAYGGRMPVRTCVL